MSAAFPGWLDQLHSDLAGYVGRQRWYSGESAPDADSVGVKKANRLWSAADGDHALWQVLLAVGPDCYQLIVGQRPAGEPADFLHGHEGAVIGAVDSWYFYDATLDSDMARELLIVASGGRESATLTRPLSAEQSNTSLVYDERLIFKVFRRLRPGPNPDVEVTTALAGAGFEQVAAPLIRWSDDDYDLGFGQQFLAGGAEGWALALTSLRDLYNIPGAVPADAGGDFAGEAERLGRVTADMHVALSEVFLPDPSGGRRAWEALVAGLPGRLEEAGRFADTDWAAGAAGLLKRLGDLSDPGPAIRVHGDFHLGQVMRTDTGWFILDFEGEPTKPVEERTMPTSALKDVTSMLRSFHYASRHAIIERALPDWAELEPLARSWESHNRQAFLDGYESNPSIHGLLPDPALAPLVISAFELDKALYELDYERSHRPEWVSIPIDALDRLIHGGSRGAAGT